MTDHRIFKYYPDDFGALTVSVIHMDLIFDVYDDHTHVNSCLHVKTLDETIKILALNAKNLEILKISCDGQDVPYAYDKNNDILIIKFIEDVPPDTDIHIETETICRPTDNILEGLYYDVTPAGAPPQQITQCQQWGFQRLVPCIDDMTAKCTYSTTIIADERYTNIISNGDVEKALHPDGDCRVSITYNNTITPMAPYLFFLGVGTYETFTRIFEYPDGDWFTLELLVPPGSDPDIAGQSLEILADAIMWIHLFTGPEQYRYVKIRNEISQLVKQRDLIIEDNLNQEDLTCIRQRLRELIRTIQPGYKYTGTVYREIGMQNSDFGGMENVGNTTITTNRIMPFPEATDSSYEYMIRVKVHEFYHNLNGSEVTGYSPFEIWLNEAVTVFIEDQYHAYLFGEAYSRLQTVLNLLSPSGGTFYYDRGAGSMPIEPDGFNDPNDLITAVTYVKSPEFVRMIEKLMGRESFVRALDRYHKRYRHSNATRAQWLEIMEEESGLNFMKMAQQWLKQTGYPEVEVDSAYDLKNRTYSIHIKQSQSGTENLWEFPFTVTLVDSEGKDLAEQMIRMENREETVIFEDTDEPAFLSLNRGYGFYGKEHDDAGDDLLILQVRRDSDIVNRFVAFYRLADREKMRLLAYPDEDVSELFVDLFFELISDKSLMDEAGGQFLTLFESVDDENVTHHYKALYDVKQKIFRSIATHYQDELISLYHEYDSRITGSSDLALHIADIKCRQVKNLCLNILASLDTPEVILLARQQFDCAANADDKLTAFGCYLNSSAGDRLELLELYEESSRDNPVRWEAYLAAIAGNSSVDTVSILKNVESSSAFHIELANDQRALYGRFAQNKKISLETDAGREFLSELLPRLAEINEYSTVSILSVFGNIDLMEEGHQIPLVHILLSLLRSLDMNTTPSVYNTTKRLMLGSPKAVARYEQSVNEKIDEIK